MTCCFVHDRQRPWARPFFGSCQAVWPAGRGRRRTCMLLHCILLAALNAEFVLDRQRRWVRPFFGSCPEGWRPDRGRRRMCTSTRWSCAAMAPSGMADTPQKFTNSSQNMMMVTSLSTWASSFVAYNMTIALQ